MERLVAGGGMSTDNSGMGLMKIVQRLLKYPDLALTPL